MFKSLLIVGLILVVGCGGVRKFSEAEYGEKFSKYNENKLNLSDVDKEDYLDVAIQELSKKLAKNIVERSLYNVVVFQFTDGRQSTSPLGREISTKITGAIVQCDLPDSFSVIGRDQILYADYLSEQQQDRLKLPTRNPEFLPLERRGMIDASIRTAIRGEFRERDKKFNISAELIDLRTGKVYAASTVNIPKTSSMIWDATSDQYIYNLDHNN